MKIVLIGIQGSGKSTQGNLLSKQLNVPYLSTGHIFREIAKEKTTLGHYIKITMNSGLLIPDDKTIEIVNNYLSRPEYHRGYILDGFPRTTIQARQFKNHVDKVIYINISQKDALWRLLHRKDSDRGDETLPALKKRIDLFYKSTTPVIKHYETEGKLATIDGTKSIKDVNEEILKSLGKQLIKNQIMDWKKKSKAIIAIVGLSGSGKTEAAEYFKSKNLPIIHFGQVINDYIDKHKLAHNESIHKQLRQDIRKKYGYQAMAVLNEEKIKKALANNLVIIIDGLYSWEEYKYLKNKFTNVNIYLLAIYANKTIRYKRALNRSYRPNLSHKERDIDELEGTNKGAPIAFADFLIKNNFSLEEFHDKLEQVYREVYFS
jgi:adenylate kinase